MTDKAVPSEKAPVVPGPVVPPVGQAFAGAVLPPFVCVLPCTAPPVKYLDRLDGCASGLHVTREDTKDLQLSLYGTMADVIMAKEDRVGATAPDPCAFCKAPMMARPSFPHLYMENCVHHFHYSCLVFLQCGQRSMLACSHCKVVSSRLLLWPELFDSEAVKNDTFQLQKRCMGLDVAPQTVLQVDRELHCSTFKCSTFKVNVNSKTLILRKRPPSGCDCDSLPRVPGREPSGDGDWIYERFHRMEALRNFRCPFDQRQNGPSGGQCTEGKECNFWHELPTGTEMERTVQRPKGLRNFPQFFCLRSSTVFSPDRRCCKRIRVHSQELVRCLAGFHPTLEDLKDLDGFACKIAKQIMAPVVVSEPEQPLDCAFCHKPQAEPNSVRLHLQKCVHWLHVSCLAQARLAHSTNTNGALSFPCPTCQVSSVRMLAWPGPLQSNMAKQTIFSRQLEQFNLQVNSDIALSIVQVPNQLNVFTVSCGSDCVVTFDAEAAPENSFARYN